MTEAMCYNLLKCERFELNVYSQELFAMDMFLCRDILNLLY